VVVFEGLEICQVCCASVSDLSENKILTTNIFEAHAVGTRYLDSRWTDDREVIAE